MKQKLNRLRKLTLLAMLPAIIFWTRVGLAQEQVKIHNPSFDISVITLFVAKEKGYFRDEGLDPLFILATPGVGINGLIAGNFDFSAAGGSASTAIARGMPLKVLLIHTFKPGFWIFTRENLSPSQLKGKKIAVSTFGSLVHTLARLGLKKMGVDADKEVIMIAAGTDDVRFAALKSGAVDAAVFNTPTSIKARKEGLKETIFLGDEVLGLSGGVVTHQKLIDTQPGTILKVMTAAVKGLKYFVANREGAIPIMAKYMRAKPEVAREIYEASIQTFTPDGMRGEDFMKSEAQIQATSLALKEIPPFERPFDLSFARRANEKLKGWNPQ
jgi:NitT/TauT family transport system substrate-binding protein